MTVTLEESYARCRELNRRYGTTYYWSAALLPKVKRHHVHALYGFCRYADDIVDNVGRPGGAPTPPPRRRWGPLPIRRDVGRPGGAPTPPPRRGWGPLPIRRSELGSTATIEERQVALAEFGDRFFVDLDAGRSDDPVLKAVCHTVRAFDIDPDYFRRFLKSMNMDFTIETYETFDDLCDYMDGSAAVIGEMMLPILEPTRPEAFDHARDLGIAFQLSNFWRDVAEDLDRGRVYVPQEDLRTFGADPWERRVTPGWRRCMAFEIARTRRFFDSADKGIAMLPDRSGRCIRGARALYSGILDRIEAVDYDVFSQRVRVPTWRKLAVAARISRPHVRGV